MSEARRDCARAREEMPTPIMRIGFVEGEPILWVLEKSRRKE
jgi:hypothetical protein